MHPPQGKISRLPHHIREHTHVRLRDGEKGGQIVAWLNSSPEVKAVLAAAFGGRPITEPNLSEWKKRNHPEWLLQQAARAQADRFIAESRQFAQAGQGALTEHLATVVAARYALATLQLPDCTDPELHMQTLRALCRDVASLRRGDHNAQWLRLSRDRMALDAFSAPSPNANPANNPAELKASWTKSSVILSSAISTVKSSVQPSLKIGR